MSPDKGFFNRNSVALGTAKSGINPCLSKSETSSESTSSGDREIIQLASLTNQLFFVFGSVSSGKLYISEIVFSF
ncbi:MAG: hypothetical protein WCR56_00810 [Bacilli bacterium]|jgi:hypothetical protein